MSDLSPEQYQRLEQRLLKEIRRAQRQNIFVMGLQGVVMVVLAILIFRVSRQYHDFSLWAIGICLLIFALLHFLDMEFFSTGRSWMDLFSREDKMNE